MTDLEEAAMRRHVLTVTMRAAVFLAGLPIGGKEVVLVDNRAAGLPSSWGAPPGGGLEVP